MKRDLDALERTEHDLAIVGGGIYGVCAAREAALRGLRVCLLERGDFGGATSSQSLRILHGGLRFLQHLDLRRMREHIAERRTLMRIAPHLVDPLPCVIPTYGHGLRGKEVLEVALFLNDLVGYDRNRGLAERHRLPRGGVLSRAEFARMCPGIPEQGVTGGALWYDARAWSTERLLLAFLEAAVLAGAKVANRVEVVGALEDGRRITGLRARDVATGRTLTVRSRVVLNAAGPWVDSFLASIGGIATRPTFRPSKGMNLLVRRIFGDHAVGVPAGADFRDRDALLDKGARLLFFVPWHGRSLVGTKHLPYDGEPDSFSITRQDVEAFLAEINAALPSARLSLSDVVAVAGGMLPEAAGGGGGVQLEKHHRIVDHAREDAVEGLVTVVGVKWTTARRVAAEALDLVAGKLGSGTTSAGESAPVAGGDIPDYERFLAEGKKSMPRSVPASSHEHLLRAHGTGVAGVLAHIAGDEELARPLSHDSPVIGAELVHAALHEMALHLEDAVLRRTHLWLAGPLGAALLERAAGLMAPVLGWDRLRTAREIERAQGALERLRPGLGEVP